MLISVLIAIALFSILSHALFTLISASYQLVSLNKSRITAKFMAQEEIEMIKNLAYEDIGTVGGVPNGIIVPEEIYNKNGLLFTVKRSVIYIDDPYDGTGEDDAFPDYKRVRVEVSWEGLASSKKNPTVMLTDISPNILTSSAGTGTLFVAVTDAYGLPVSNALVNIRADTLTPPVNTNLQTSFEGTITIPGSVPCTDCYKITVTKSGYSSDKTYGTDEVTNPINPHVSVIEGKVVQVGFSIDKVATLNVYSFNNRENNFTTLASVPFILKGAKIIGTNAEAEPVYKYEKSLITDSSGELVIQNLEWDNYNILMPSGSSWDISGTNPLLPINLSPNTIATFNLSLNSHSTNSVLNIIKDTSQKLIENAYVTVTEGAYTQEIISGLTENPDYGQAYYPNLDIKTYNIEATASGFLKYSSTLDMSGNIKNDIIMSKE